MKRQTYIGGAAIAAMTGFAGAAHGQCAAVCENAASVHVVLAATCPPAEGTEAQFLKETSGLFSLQPAVTSGMRTKVYMVQPDGSQREIWLGGEGSSLSLMPVIAMTQPGGGGGGPPSSRSVTTLSRVDESGTVTVIVEGGSIKAEIDGESVSSDRIKRDGDIVTVLGEDGNVRAWFHVPRQTMTARVTTSEPTATGRARIVGPDLFMTLQLDETPPPTIAAQPTSLPPVMLGVTMAELPDSLAEYLGLSPTEAFVFERVGEGLPAAKAGLKRFDVVVKIEGADETTQDALRRVLRTKKPGDTLKLVVMRQGQKKDVEVKLEAFQPERLAVVGAVEPAQPGVFQWSHPGVPGAPAGHEALEQARTAIEQAMRAVPHQGREAVEAARQAIESAMREMQSPEQRARMAEQFIEWQRRQFAPSATVQGGGAPAAPDAAVIQRQREQLEQQRRELEEVRMELREIKTLLRRLLEERGGR